MFEYFPDNYAWSLAVLMAVNSGGVLSEIDDACRPLIPEAAKGHANAAWATAWQKIASRVESQAKTDLVAGHKRSAGRKFRRAAVYSFVAERNMDNGAHRTAIYAQALKHFRSSVELLGEAVEWVEIPYKGKSMPALFIKARNASGRTPCMVHFDGLDVMKELLHLRGIANELTERGISVLLVDHPGVGEALRSRNLPGFPETEQQASPCVDYLEKRADVDPKRIGIIALSLGGYFAPRAAAFEKRFMCCVAWGAIYDYGAITEGRAKKAGGALSVSDWAGHMKWVFGKDTIEEVVAVTKKMTLEGVMDKITCPILITHGENDRQVPLWHAEKTYEGAINSPRRELRVFTIAEGGAEHCQLDNLANGMDYMTDWIADVMGVA